MFILPLVTGGARQERLSYIEITTTSTTALLPAPYPEELRPNWMIPLLTICNQWQPSVLMQEAGSAF